MCREKQRLSDGIIDDQNAQKKASRGGADLKFEG